MIGWTLALAALVTASTTTAAQTLFSEDFSTGAPGWTIDSPLCCGVTWKADALPASVPNGPFHSAPASLNFNNDVDYEGGSGTATATSPPIDLSVAVGTPV